MAKLKTTTKQEEKKASKFDPQKLKSQKDIKQRDLFFNCVLKPKGMI